MEVIAAQAKTNSLTSKPLTKWQATPCHYRL
jgi:hypothetical protein